MGQGGAGRAAEPSAIDCLQLVEAEVTRRVLFQLRVSARAAAAATLAALQGWAEAEGAAAGGLLAGARAGWLAVPGRGLQAAAAPARASRLEHHPALLPTGGENEARRFASWH